MGKRLERIFGLSPMKIEADSLLVEQFGADTALVKCTAVDIISTQDALDLIVGAPLPDAASAEAEPEAWGCGGGNQSSAELIAEELEGMADSLDEHVSRDEVYGALMSLSARIKEQGA